MAQTLYKRAADRRKAHLALAAGRLPSPTTHGQADSPSHRHPLCPTERLTVDQYVRLLKVVDGDGAGACLDDVVQGLPGVAQPISAILDLCDAGVLQIDLDAAFDGNTRVWRHEH